MVLAGLAVSGSHQKPALLWEAFIDGNKILAEPAVFEEGLNEASTGRNVNIGDLHPREWLRMFRHAGFISDGASQPTEPVTVYHASGAQMS